MASVLLPTPPLGFAMTMTGTAFSSFSLGSLSDERLHGQEIFVQE
jgi:hypothetical protein